MTIKDLLRLVTFSGCCQLRQNGGTYVRYIFFDAICEELKNFHEFRTRIQKRTFLLFGNEYYLYQFRK